MEISTGTPEAHPSLLPLDPGAAGVGMPTSVAGQQSAADQGGVRDLTGERLGQLAGYEQDAAAAMHAGMAAEDGRRQHYAQDILPTGSNYGDQPVIPPVPVNLMPPPPVGGYPDQGDEPIPAA